MSAGEKALSTVVRSGLRGQMFAQDAIQHFRKLRSQAVQYPLEQSCLDVFGRLMQERIGELQRLCQDRGMHRLGVDARDCRHLFQAFAASSIWCVSKGSLRSR